METGRAGEKKNIHYPAPRVPAILSTCGIDLSETKGRKLCQENVPEGIRERKKKEEEEEKKKKRKEKKNYRISR